MAIKDPSVAQTMLKSLTARVGILTTRFSPGGLQTSRPTLWLFDWAQEESGSLVWRWGHAQHVRDTVKHAGGSICLYLGWRCSLISREAGSSDIRAVMQKAFDVGRGWRSEHRCN